MDKFIVHTRYLSSFKLVEIDLSVHKHLSVKIVKSLQSHPTHSKWLNLEFLEYSRLSSGRKKFEHSTYKYNSNAQIWWASQSGNFIE